MSGEADIAHDILRSIRQIVRRISEHSKHLYREAGLTVPQLICLKTIGELEPTQDEITNALVCSHVQLSAATVSRIIERLVRSGLVKRERRAKDRRKVCLSLTAAGAERYRSLPTPLHERFVQRLMNLESEERLVLLSALRRITELMEASDLDSSLLLGQEDGLDKELVTE